MTVYSGRLGYIFNNNPLTFKTFMFFGGFAPSPYVMYYQRLLSKNPINPQKAVALSGEIIYRHNSSIYSLLCSRTYFTHMIYFNGKEYKNASNKERLNSISAKYTYNFDPFNSITFNAWVYHLHSNKSYKFYGGYVSIFNKLGKFDLYNDLSYRDGYEDQKPAFNLNSTVTYHATKNLVLYAKGNNLLNKAITTDYYRINPLTGEKTILKRVPVFDRTIWIGMEYKF
jgi:iron complex outermembrane receptor protein